MDEISVGSVREFRIKIISYSFIKFKMRKINRKIDCLIFPTTKSRN